MDRHKKISHFPTPHCRNLQHGSALVVSLLILLVMTLIGVTALNTSLLEEKMAANTQKKTVAFQDAESAINFAMQEIIKPTDTKLRDAMDIHDGVEGVTVPVIDPPQATTYINGETIVKYEGQQLPAGYSMDKFVSLQLRFEGTGKAPDSNVTSNNIQGALRNAPKP